MKRMALLSDTKVVIIFQNIAVMMLFLYRFMSLFMLLKA